MHEQHVFCKRRRLWHRKNAHGPPHVQDRQTQRRHLLVRADFRFPRGRNTTNRLLTLVALLYIFSRLPCACPHQNLCVCLVMQQGTTIESIVEHSLCDLDFVPTPIIVLHALLSFILPKYHYHYLYIIALHPGCDRAFGGGANAVLPGQN